MTKKKIFDRLKNILNDNGISIYRLAQITNINRTTMQKAFSCDRNLSLRQFQDILKVLPISNPEKEDLYNDFFEGIWSKEQITRNKLILKILDNISNNIVIEHKPLNYKLDKDLYSIDGIVSKDDFLKIVEYTIATNANKHLQIYAYVPFYNDFFNKAITKHIKNYSINCNVSVLFEFLNNSNKGIESNLHTFNNIVPMLTDIQERFKLNYVYVDSYFYKNHLSAYPYYIVFDTVTILIDSSLENMMIMIQ